MAIFERTYIFQPIILGIHVSFFPGVHPVGPRAPLQVLVWPTNNWSRGRIDNVTRAEKPHFKRTGRVVLARCPLGIWSKPNKSTFCVYVFDIPVFASHNQACDSVKDQDCFVSTGCNRLLLKGVLERTISCVLNPIFPLNV